MRQLGLCVRRVLSAALWAVIAPSRETFAARRRVACLRIAWLLAQ